MHFGIPDHASSLVREKHFVKWLHEITPKAKALYLVGDVFDFWFEYKHVQPRGYVRLLGKLAEMADEGIEIHLFPGNHDLWFRDLFPKEIGAIYHTEPLEAQFFGKKYYIAHGDGLGPGDHGYKLLKAILTNPISHWLFARLHPNFAFGLANFSSRLSRNHNREKVPTYQGEKEYLYHHCMKLLSEGATHDYFVFGHRHLKMEIPLSSQAKMIYLGDWIRHFSYLELSEDGVYLNTYPLEKQS